jgi:hypothetical protein
MTTMTKTATALAVVLLLGACAGRDPQQIAVVQPQDAASDCTALTAELNANATRIAALSKESSNTTAGNVALGVAGALLFWPVLFAMDFKDASGKDAAALQQRNSYLATVATQRCGYAVAAPQPTPAAQPKAEAKLQGATQ